MELKDFLNKVVVTRQGRRFYLHEITSPTIRVVSTEPNPQGHYEFYRWPTINGDPFATGALRFEDESLALPFRKAYDAYQRTEDAYWEEYGYWMRKD